MCWMTFTFGCFHSHRRDRRSIDDPVDVLFIELDQQIWNEFFRFVVRNEEQFAGTSCAFQEEFHLLSGQPRTCDRDNAFWFEREIIDRCCCFFTDRRLCALQIVGVFIDDWHRRKVAIWTKLLVTNDWRGPFPSFPGVLSRARKVWCRRVESRWWFSSVPRGDPGLKVCFLAEQMSRCRDAEWAEGRWMSACSGWFVHWYASQVHSRWTLRKTIFIIDACENRRLTHLD